MRCLKVTEVVLVLSMVLFFVSFPVAPATAVSLSDPLLDSKLRNLYLRKTDGSNGNRSTCLLGQIQHPKTLTYTSKVLCGKRDDISAILYACIPSTKTVRFDDSALLLCLFFTSPPTLSSAQQALYDQMKIDLTPSYVVVRWGKSIYRSVHNAAGKKIGKVKYGAPCRPFYDTHKKNHLEVTATNGKKGFAPCEFK